MLNKKKGGVVAVHGQNAGPNSSLGGYNRKRAKAAELESTYALGLEPWFPA